MRVSCRPKMFHIERSRLRLRCFSDVASFWGSLEMLRTHSASPDVAAAPNNALQVTCETHAPERRR